MSCRDEGWVGGRRREGDRAGGCSAEGRRSRDGLEGCDKKSKDLILLLLVPFEIRCSWGILRRKEGEEEEEEPNHRRRESSSSLPFLSLLPASTWPPSGLPRSNTTDSNAGVDLEGRKRVGDRREG